MAQVPQCASSLPRSTQVWTPPITQVFGRFAGHEHVLFEHDLPSISAIRDAAAWLLRGPDPKRPAFNAPPLGGVRPAGAPESRPVTVRLENATVREIFDAIGRANPDLTWGVHYLDANGTVPQVEYRLNERNSSTSATVALPGKR